MFAGALASSFAGISALPTHEDWAEKTNNLGVIEVRMVAMRDGTKLHTEILSTGNRSTPTSVVLDRSPYGGLGTELIADIYGALGDFVAIGQDMRGSGKSKGNFSVWRDDGQDAFDTMQWVIKQPWSNGKVFTVGASADGIAQFVQPKWTPPPLVAQFIIWATIDAQSTVYPGGAYRAGLIDQWLKGTVPSQAAHLMEVTRDHNGAGEWWDNLNASAPDNWKVRPFTSHVLLLV
jgi:putative CocE/NonD family hydrolase